MLERGYDTDIDIGICFKKPLGNLYASCNLRFININQISVLPLHLPK